MDPMMLATQLTLLEFTLYKRIRPADLIQRSRGVRPGKLQDSMAPIIQLSNRVGSQTFLLHHFLVCNSYGHTDYQLGGGFYS